MKYIALCAATAMIALGGCKETASNVTETPNAADTSAELNMVDVPEATAPTSAEPPAPAGEGAAAFTVGEAPTKAFMAGTWGEGDGCSLPINFQADGTIKDGPFEKWDIKDGMLVMEGSPQKLKLKIVDEKTMESQIEGEGKVSILKRC